MVPPLTREIHHWAAFEQEGAALVVGLLEDVGGREVEHEEGVEVHAVDHGEEEGEEELCSAAHHVPLVQDAAHLACVGPDVP